MSKRDPELYLRDILDSINKIESLVKNMSYKKFLENEMVIDAVIRNIEIIGEAVKNLPDETKKSHPNIPWNKIIDTRNKVIHEYFGVDIEILWKTITDDLSKLKEQVEKIV